MKPFSEGEPGSLGYLPCFVLSNQKQTTTLYVPASPIPSQGLDLSVLRLVSSHEGPPAPQKPQNVWKVKKPNLEMASKWVVTHPQKKSSKLGHLKCLKKKIMTPACMYQERRIKGERMSG